MCAVGFYSLLPSKLLTGIIGLALKCQQLTFIQNSFIQHYRQHYITSWHITILNTGNWIEMENDDCNALKALQSKQVDFKKNT